MGLTTRQWNTIAEMTTERARYAGPLKRRLGGQRALDRLVELGHLAWSGGSVVRTRVSVDAFGLYGAVPEDGRSISNSAARLASQLSDARYSAAKHLLLQTQEIRTARGRGGSIKRVDYDPGTRAGASEREQDLYEPLRSWLSQQTDIGSPAFDLVKIIGNGAGARRQTGQWSKPDLARVRVIQYVTLPQVDVEVDAFEVKPYRNARNLTGIYESSAHQRRAHSATLVIEWPFDDDNPIPTSITLECNRLGVGLIQFWAEQGEVLLPAARQNPAPDAIDRFIQDVLSDDDLVTYLQAIGRAPADLGIGEDDDG